jgi:hypothetical protein
VLFDFENDFSPLILVETNEYSKINGSNCANKKEKLENQIRFQKVWFTMWSV